MFRIIEHIARVRSRMPVSVNSAQLAHRDEPRPLTSLVLGLLSGLLSGLLLGLHRSWATTGRKLPGSNLGLWRKKSLQASGRIGIESPVSRATQMRRARTCRSRRPSGGRSAVGDADRRLHPGSPAFLAIVEQMFDHAAAGLPAATRWVAIILLLRAWFEVFRRSTNFPRRRPPDRGRRNRT